jgi:hypothetical protein
MTQLFFHKLTEISPIVVVMYISLIYLSAYFIAGFIFLAATPAQAGGAGVEFFHQAPDSYKLTPGSPPSLKMQILIQNLIILTLFFYRLARTRTLETQMVGFV